MTYTDFRQLLKSPDKLSGGFLFCGDEEYTKISALRELRAQERFSGERVGVDCSGDTVAEQNAWLSRLSEEMGGLSMFAGSKLIELHAIPFSKLKADIYARLLVTLGDLEFAPDTTLVLYAEGHEIDLGNEKRPSKVFKELSALLRPVCFSRETGERLTSWVGRHIKSCGAETDLPTLNRLIEYCGTDMTNLAKEAAKIAYYTLGTGKSRVDARDIPLVCRSESVTGAFDFSNALLDRNVGEALRLLAEMKAQREPPEVIMSAVISSVTQCYLVAKLAERRMPKSLIASETGIHEYRVGLMLNSTSRTPIARIEENLRAVSDADKKIKTTGLDAYTVIAVLLVRILA